MKYFSGLCVFALQLSVAFAATPPQPRRRPYYGASDKHETAKYEQDNLALDVTFENFRDAEAEILEEEVLELLSHQVPVALTAAIKRDDPFQIFPGIGDEGWSIVQMALVHLSSILFQHDLTFVGGRGGMDLSELWENACAGGEKDVAVWHGYKSKGRREGSNTIAVCSSFFEKPAAFSLKALKPSEVCKMSNEQVMGLKSTILLQELAQTSHVGEGLRPREKIAIEGVEASRVRSSQGILQKAEKANMDLEQVDVGLFSLYVTLAWRRGSLCKN